jgi:hypothetical protein
MRKDLARFATVVALFGVAACSMFNGTRSVSDGERNSADIGMAPYADFGNSADSPAGANASAASSNARARGPAASNYNGPNTPPDPSPRPTAGWTG